MFASFRYFLMLGIYPPFTSSGLIEIIQKEEMLVHSYSNQQDVAS